MNTLRLFGVVPVDGIPNHTGEPKVVKGFPVVVLSSAMEYYKEVVEFCETSLLTEKMLNATSFYKSWKHVAEIPLEVWFIQQALHYITTYGFRELGMYDPLLVYVPESKDTTTPLEEPFMIVYGVSKDEIVDKCLDLLAANAAYKQETIELILGTLEECGYEFTGSEQIGNNEVKAILADRLGLLPTNGDDLFRYLIYRVTGSTLVIKNRVAIEAISKSGFEIPELDATQMIELSKGFYRNKPLWLAFKKAHKNNSPIVNKIRKLAAKHHEAVRIPLIEVITATEDIKSDELRKYLKTVTTRKLVKAIQAVRYHASTDARFYQIRSGSTWVEVTKRPDNGKYGRVEEALLEELWARLDNKEFPRVENLRPAMPISEKQFLGPVPNFSAVQARRRYNQCILVGIYWKDTHPNRPTDLDLSAIDQKGNKVGWNTTIRNNGIMYSGDITSAPFGASEWLIVDPDQFTTPTLVLVNPYNISEGHKFKVIVGYAENKDNYHNHMIDPSKVIFSAEVSVDGQSLLGILLPKEDGVEFRAMHRKLGGSRVSRGGDNEETAISALIERATSAVMMDELMLPTDKNQEMTLGTYLPFLDV